MASTVAKSSQRSPVTRIIGYSFLLPVIGTTTAFTMSDPTAIIGHRPSIRTIRAARTAWTSIQAATAGTSTTGISADLSVLSQNKNKGGSADRCSEASNRGEARRQPRIPDKTWAKPEKIDEADKIAMTCSIIFVM